MRIESLALVASIIQTSDGDLIHALPAIESFVLADDPRVSKPPVFYAFMALSYGPDEGGRRVIYEATIYDPAGEIITSQPLKPQLPLPVMQTRGAYKQAIPMMAVKFRTAGTHEIRITIRDLGTPDGGILARRRMSFTVST